MIPIGHMPPGTPANRDHLCPGAVTPIAALGWGPNPDEQDAEMIPAHAKKLSGPPIKVGVHLLHVYRTGIDRTCRYTDDGRVQTWRNKYKGTGGTYSASIDGSVLIGSGGSQKLFRTEQAAAREAVARAYGGK